MRCLVIGLGNFGTALVKELNGLGHEVVAVDTDERAVDAIKDIVEGAYIMDTSDESAVQSLPLKEIDLTIVAISENLAASLRTIVILKQKGVKNIYARAYDAIHKSILEGLGDLKIIMPEVEMAKTYADRFTQLQ